MYGNITYIKPYFTVPLLNQGGVAGAENGSSRVVREYNSFGIMPRRLRVSLEPARGADSTELLVKTEDACGNYGANI